MLNRIKSIFVGKKKPKESLFDKNIRHVKKAISQFGVQDFAGDKKAEARHVDYVFWGEDNLLPQKILFVSATNNIVGSITEAYKEMLVGNGFKLQTGKAYEFLQSLKIPKILERIAYDLVLCEGFSVEIFSDVVGSRFVPVNIRHLPFSRVRFDKANIDGNRYRYYSAVNWSVVDFYGNVRHIYEKSEYMHLYEVKQHYPYLDNNNSVTGLPVALYVDYEYHPSNDYYPKPDLQTLLGFGKISEQAQEFHVNYFKNGIMGSIIVNIPFERGNLKVHEVEEMKQKLVEEAQASWIGSQRSGQPFFNLYEVDGDGRVIIPKAEISGFPGDQNDRKYIEMFHTIDEQLLLGMGVVAPKAFGLNGTDNSLEKPDVMVMAYDITEKFRLKNKRKMIESFVNLLIERAGIDDYFSIPFVNIAKPAIEVIQRVEKDTQEEGGAQ